MLLRGHGLDLASARAQLRRLSAAGLMPRPRAHDAGALRAVGIDMQAVRQQLVTAFGEHSVGAAVWRASRRPWWRGGGRRRTPLCGPPFFAKHAIYLARCHARSREATTRSRRDVTATGLPPDRSAPRAPPGAWCTVAAA